ncbi:MAG: peptidoglycan DD-metalloendopeptidase family protein [Synergistaceae bacterium]|jgi:murein DD-endopeptidase MepM/ murein hydrolase activator NlpD|nr:peptidoglycan DD-metalloendopeptidase family protein [Synergistaceae bacterium]
MNVKLALRAALFLLVMALFAAQAESADDTASRLAALRRDAANARREADLLQGRIDRLKKNADSLNAEIKALTVERDRLMASLRVCLIDMYKYGTQEEMNVLFSSKTAHDAMNSANMLSRFSRRNQTLLNSLAARMERLDRAKAALAVSEHRLVVANDALSSQMRRYRISINALNRTIAAAEQANAAPTAPAAEGLAAPKGFVNPGPSIGMGQTTDGMRLDVNSGVFATPGNAVDEDEAEKLDWPLKGPVASYYGLRDDPVLKTRTFNSGIDIRAAAGAPICAAGPGRVTFVGSVPGMGVMVIIDHGDGLSTVYANLGTASVKSKESVKAGTVIGNARLADSSGVTFHFEVRVGGLTVNPLSRMKKY